MIRRTMILAALALAGCDDNRPAQQRRERMVQDCIAYDGNPIECAQAAEIAIPEGRQ